LCLDVPFHHEGSAQQRYCFDKIPTMEKVSHSLARQLVSTWQPY
jgi:hypothetical protein